MGNERSNILAKRGATKRIVVDEIGTKTVESERTTEKRKLILLEGRPRITIIAYYVHRVRPKRTTLHNRCV